MEKIALLLLFAVVFLQCSTDNELETTCSTPAVIRDLTGLDGCGFVFELTDGTRLEPQRMFFCGTPPLPKEVTEDPLYNFIFVDGKHVFISYEETEGASPCMVGKMVKITCISEARSTQKD
jgi:hypothetical protein